MTMRNLTIPALLACALVASADDKPPQPAKPKPDKPAAAKPAPAAPVDDLAAARAAEQVFAGKLYQVLAGFRQDQNLVYSPFGAFESLAMLEIGARGPSAESLRAVAGPGKEWAAAFARMRATGGPRTFGVAKSVLSDNGGYGVKLSKPLAEDSDFAEAGLHAGDLIFTVNDEPVRSVDEFNAMCRKVRGKLTVSGYDVESGQVFQDRAVSIRATASADAPPDQRPMNFARAVWIKAALAEKSPYPAELEKLYGAKVFPFTGKPQDLDAAASEFFRKETGGKIDKLGFADLPADLEMLLVNVLAMNAEWDRKFDATQTRSGDFASPEGKVPADYLVQQALYAFASLENVLVLEIPYKDSDLVFRAYLPSEPGKLALLERELAVETRLDEAATKSLKKQEVHVRLPKFRVETNASLRAALSSLGLEDLFTDKADLTGIDSADRLKVDDVRQMSYLEIDETGTRAGAKTEVRIVPKGLPPKVVEFHATHPFIFQVRDSAGTIFLMGRVMKPQPPKGPGKEALDK